MTEIFASLYEFFGFLPFYSKDFADHLRGWAPDCSGYTGTVWYNIIAFTMTGVTALGYALMYHIIDSPKWNKKQHWWIVALVILALNWFIAFIIPFNAIRAGNYCKELLLTINDCVGFGFSNAIWSLILFTLLTSFKYPKLFSINCRYTTLWNP